LSRSRAVAAGSCSSSLPGPAAVPDHPTPACTFTAGGDGCRGDRLLSNVHFPYEV